MEPRLSSTWRNSLPRRALRRALRPVILPIRRRVRERVPRAGILMYHRIATEAVDPWNLCVSPASFEEHVALLARRNAAVDLAVFAEGGMPGGVENRAGNRLAITFDDAYRDNIEVALPILEKHGVPATFFVVSQALGRTREFWWDALARAVLESGRLPTTLEIELDGQERRFTIADDSALAPVPTRWNADRDAPRNGREQLYFDLWQAIIVLPPAGQDRATDAVLVWAGVSAEGPASRHPATREQIAALAGHPLVRIGNHTRHHLSLPDHGAERQRDEIAGCHRDLTELIGAPVDRMSYPYGRHDARARAAVAELGIPLACTSYPVAVHRATPRNQLPRLQVLDSDGDTFARWLYDEYALLARTA